MTVGLVIVSHSALLASGVVELASQMAPDVRLCAAGGLPDGGLGTDFDRVAAALAGADDGGGAVLLYDLGSARMIAEMAAEAHEDPGRVRVAEAPLVEGAVAAAVAAQGGASLAAVVAAAESGPVESTSSSEPATSVEIELRNKVGLHARPAALLARTVAELDAEVSVRFGEQSADARSVLALLGLSAGPGARVEVSARGAQADEALRRVQDLAARNFDE